jgi:hypothetical protein
MLRLVRDSISLDIYAQAGCGRAGNG